MIRYLQSVITASRICRIEIRDVYKRQVGKVCDNRYRDYAVRDYLKEHPSIKEYVVVDDDIKEYSSKDIPLSLIHI